MMGTMGLPFKRRHFEVTVMVSPRGFVRVPCEAGISRPAPAGTEEPAKANEDAASKAAAQSPRTETMFFIFIMKIVYQNELQQSTVADDPTRPTHGPTHDLLAFTSEIWYNFSIVNQIDNRKETWMKAGIFTVATAAFVSFAASAGDVYVSISTGKNKNAGT
jgi:hypothetical protein